MESGDLHVLLELFFYKCDLQKKDSEFVPKTENEIVLEYSCRIGKTCGFDRKQYCFGKCYFPNGFCILFTYLGV